MKSIVSFCKIFSVAIVLSIITIVFYYYPTVYREIFPVSVLHYRINVVFEVDGELVSGSSVQKLIVRRVRGIGNTRASWSTYGEALIVELPKHGPIYVLMTSPTRDGTYSFSTKGRFDFLVSDACKLKEQRGERNWSEYVQFVGNLSGTCNIPDEALPLIVRFKDVAVPTSVERVYPEHLGEALGPDVQFVKATVTITSEPLTRKIDDHLSWLHDDVGGQLTPHFVTSRNPTLSDILRRKYFQRLEQ